MVHRLVALLLYQYLLLLFQQPSSSKTQICNTLKPTEIEFDAQEDVLDATQSIDFDNGDVMIKKSGIYLVIAGPQIAKLRGEKQESIRDGQTKRLIAEEASRKNVN